MATHGREEPLGRKLLRIKEELEVRKAARSEKQGELKSLMSQLKSHGANTLEQAEALIKEQDAELRQMETAIKEGVQDIEQQMEGD